MITIHNTEHFNEVMGFAVKRGLAHQLVHRLNYLSSYAQHRTNTEKGGIIVCHLQRDFAAHSFVFQVNLESTTDGVNVPIMNGGLIYQGPGLPADGSFPQLTVSLSEGEGWMVHT